MSYRYLLTTMSLTTTNTPQAMSTLMIEQSAIVVTSSQARKFMV